MAPRNIENYLEIGLVILYISLFFLSKSTIFGHCQLSDSPCSDYFRYYYDEKIQEIMGIVEIPSPLPRGVPLMLRVAFNFLSILPTKHNGSLEFIKPQNVHAPVQQAIDEGNSLFYRIRFPVQQPLPFIKEIYFNNQQICVGPAVTCPIINVINYAKILYPPEFRFRFTKQLPENNSVAKPVHNVIKSEGICGTTRAMNLTSFYAENSEKTFPGQWPWLTAIYFRIREKLEFKCTGSLITQKHVISAAHCFVHNRIKIKDKVYVYLGKYYLDSVNELGSELREVAEIRIHPDYALLAYPHSDSDLAILFLIQIVQYSWMIRPICLWENDIELRKIVGQAGIVVGWGKYAKNFNNEPRIMKETIVSQEDCLRSNLAFLMITSNRTFCAGNRNGKGPCNGDSGSGLQILNPENGKYYLRGIVSLSLFNKERRTCDLNQYIVYTDVAKHFNWINEMISEN